MEEVKLYRFDEYCQMLSESITTEFFSTFGINQKVLFRPMYRHQMEYGIADEYIDGEIKAVRFTEQKVLYDIYSGWLGILFDNVLSEKVKKEEDPIEIKESIYYLIKS